MSRKVLGLIPARGGSKGIPHKNVYEINGKPLIFYTIDAALKAKEEGALLDVVVTTDGPGGSSNSPTSTNGPTSTGPDGSVSNGPGDTVVSPVDDAGIYRDDDGNIITEYTPGAVQAPDGSWILPDTSGGGPGSSSN